MGANYELHAEVRAREESDQSKDIVNAPSRLFHKSGPKTCCVLVLHKTQLLRMNNFMGYWPLQPCCSFAAKFDGSYDGPLNDDAAEVFHIFFSFFLSPSASFTLVSVKKLRVVIRSLFWLLEALLICLKATNSYEFGSQSTSLKYRINK